MDKKWIDRDGNSARIICVNAKGQYPIVALINQGGYEKVMQLTANLQASAMNSKPYLIEVSPYEDLHIDQPVIVWDSAHNKYRRHFAGVDSNGRPLTWDSRATSFSIGSHDHKVSWKHCRAATEAEIAGGPIEMEEEE